MIIYKHLTNGTKVELAVFTPGRERDADRYAIEVARSLATHRRAAVERGAIDRWANVDAVGPLYAPYSIKVFAFPEIYTPQVPLTTIKPGRHRRQRGRHRAVAA
jgi:hypothetical protein